MRKEENSLYYNTLTYLGLISRLCSKLIFVLARWMRILEEAEKEEVHTLTIGPPIK